MTYKIPEVVDHADNGHNEKVQPHYHTWSCGCRTRVERDAFVIIPCSEGCPLLNAVMEEGANNERRTR